jgi:hypothetical protein
LIGILSDSHDNVDAIKKAVKYFNSHKVDLVIHAGDIISPFTVPEFSKLKAEFIGVYGNNDGEKRLLSLKFSEMNASLQELAEIKHNGKKIVVYHGTIQAVTNALIKSGLYDVVITGHTHKSDVKRVESTLVTNPGELCGYLSGEKTLALLDTEEMDVRIVRI